MSSEKYRPSYYGGPDEVYEPVKIMDAYGWLEGYCLGAVLKHIARAGNKPGADYHEDLEKARTYLSFLIDGLGPGKETNPEASEAAESFKRLLAAGANNASANLLFDPGERRHYDSYGEEEEWEDDVGFDDDGDHT